MAAPITTVRRWSRALAVERRVGPGPPRGRPKRISHGCRRPGPLPRLAARPGGGHDRHICRRKVVDGALADLDVPVEILDGAAAFRGSRTTTTNDSMPSALTRPSAIRCRPRPARRGLPACLASSRARRRVALANRPAAGGVPACCRGSLTMPAMTTVTARATSVRRRPSSGADLTGRASVRHGDGRPAPAASRPAVACSSPTTRPAQCDFVVLYTL